MPGSAPRDGGTDAIDWPAVRAEALDLLVRYLRIDTTNPPGNEAPAARLLGAALEADGIECEYVETAPGREAVAARLRADGGGSEPALLLANHLDVVPAEAASWTEPPFGGVVRDGRIHGRGAVDMKGCGVMQLTAARLLHRRRVPLRRDLVFLAVPDEEAGSIRGMRWILRHRPDLLDGVGFALNEGGSGLTEFAGREARLFMPTVGEKSVAWLRLRATGPPGHGSLPHADNAAVRLLRALLRLADWERGLAFTPATAALTERLAAAGVLPSAADREGLEAALRSDPAAHAMFMHTLNVTIVESGVKANVIPPSAEAVLDCRLLPGETLDGWIEAVRERVGDPLVEVLPEGRDVYGVPPSDPDGELFRTIAGTLADAFEDAPVVPGLAPLATDNRFLREIGIAAYGFIPCLLSAGERAGFHAHDEYLGVASFGTGCELTYEIARRFCAREAAD